MTDEEEPEKEEVYLRLPKDLVEDVDRLPHISRNDAMIRIIDEFFQDYEFRDEKED